MTDDELIALSLRLEAETGYDSIPTVETFRRVGSHIGDDNTGLIHCCFPGCRVKGSDVIGMWRHWHFSKHGLSFGKSWKEMTGRGTTSGGPIP